VGSYVRDALAAEAVALGLSGWARSRSDGRVEATVSGDDAMVSAVIDWATRAPGVQAVDIGDGSGIFSGFETRPDA
jgi:acylphosphatase